MTRKYMNAPDNPAVVDTTRPGLDLRQLIKLVVYGLLLLNFGLYVADDWEIAAHTLKEDSSLLDWSAAFAVSIDELAWFALLFLFELETYVLPDAAFTRTRLLLMHGVRALCYLFLAHTLYAYGAAAIDLIDVPPVENTSSLCQLADAGISYGYNLEYTELDAANCASLSTDTRFHLIEEGAVVTDSAGLAIERQLVWIDLAEAAAWLVILFCIELVVRLQDRGITSSAHIRLASATKLLLYGFLWSAAAYWIYRGHYMYAWDEALWILGFFAIEMNISDWKQEIEDAG